MADRTEGFYVMAFKSANHSIQTQKKADGLLRFTVIPTPMELTNDCGISLKFAGVDFTAIEAFYKTLTVPVDLYLFSSERIEGKRKCEKIL